jgi:hypothetical protein
MAEKVILSVGTKRGLFLLESGKRRGKWVIKGPFLKGWAVQHAVIDTRGRPRLHVAAENFAHGATTLSADIAGKKFSASESPPKGASLTPKQLKLAKQWGINTSERIWYIAPGPQKQKKVLYAGAAPAALYRSENSGKTWEPVDSLNKHKTRKDWNSGFGGMSVHSIQMDPHDPKRMYAAISAAGSFRSDDAGKSWKPINDCVASYVGAPEESLVGT